MRSRERLVLTLPTAVPYTGARRPRLNHEEEAHVSAFPTPADHPAGGVLLPHWRHLLYRAVSHAAHLPPGGHRTCAGSLAGRAVAGEARLPGHAPGSSSARHRDRLAAGRALRSGSAGQPGIHLADPGESPGLLPAHRPDVPWPATLDHGSVVHGGRDGGDAQRHRVYIVVLWAVPVVAVRDKLAGGQRRAAAAGMAPAGPGPECFHPAGQLRRHPHSARGGLGADRPPTRSAARAVVARCRPDPYPASDTIAQRPTGSGDLQRHPDPHRVAAACCAPAVPALYPPPAGSAPADRGDDPDRGCAYLLRCRVHPARSAALRG